MFSSNFKFHCCCKVAKVSTIFINFFLLALTCKKVTFGFFFGASKVAPEINNIAVGIKNSSAAGANVTAKLCVVTKTILKFSIPDFVSGSQALSNLVYNLRDVESFYSNFLNCLNDQAATATAGMTIRNIQYLIYQIQTYVIPGADNIKSNAEAIGLVFGSDNTEVFETFADSHSRNFGTMVDHLKVVAADFQVAVDSGIEITLSNFKSYVNTTVLQQITSIFRDLTQAAKNLDTVVSGFTTVTVQIESVSADMQANAATTTDAYSQAIRTFSLTVNNAKKRFTTRTDVNIMSVVVSLADFENVLSNTFLDDSDMRDQRDLTREYFTNISAVFFSDNSFFQKTLLDFESNFTTLVTNARIENDANFAKLTAEVVELTAKSRGSASKCFSKTADGPMKIAQVMKYYRDASVACIQNQINVTIQSQTLKTFINEDVVLNWMGAADELCGCVVKGDKNVNQESKDCVENVSIFH